MKRPYRLSRRQFLAGTAAFALAPLARAAGGESTGKGEAPAPAEKVIDIHQHTSYHGRSDEDLVAHQRAMGITRTVLLPAGSKYGLAAGCGGNETVLRIAKEHPQEFAFFANELPDLENACQVIERYLKLGAIGIGEQKFPVDCDSPPIEKIAALAQEYGVPVLLHFQHQAYNMGLERFHKVLERFPRVRFIGHAQTWWGNIDRNHDQTVMYPEGKVTPGGITDRLLADYPNMYGDLSAGSGLNALTRDEEHARAFLERHQDKLLYGSDCADPSGRVPDCQGARTLEVLRRLVADPKVRRKILYENARRVMKV